METTRLTESRSPAAPLERGTLQGETQGLQR